MYEDILIEFFEMVLHLFSLGFSASDEMSANPSAETSKKEESGATQLTENLQDPKNVPGPVEQETEAPPTSRSFE